MPKLTAEETDNLAAAIAKALQQARSVSDSEHYDHHRWITKQIQAEERRAEFWRHMAEHAAKWGAISVLSALFYALWLGIRQEFHAHLAAFLAFWKSRNGE